MLITIKKMHCALKRETQKGNYLVKIQGFDEKNNFFRLVFYVSSDLENYLVIASHEIKRAMPFDNSEWKRSEKWGNPAEKLGYEEIDNLLLLYSKREEIINKHLESISLEEQTAYLTAKNNFELKKLGIKPMASASN